MQISYLLGWITGQVINFLILFYGWKTIYMKWGYERNSFKDFLYGLSCLLWLLWYSGNIYSFKTVWLSFITFHIFTLIKFRQYRMIRTVRMKEYSKQNLQETDNVNVNTSLNNKGTFEEVLFKEFPSVNKKGEYPFIEGIIMTYFLIREYGYPHDLAIRKTIDYIYPNSEPKFSRRCNI